MTSFSISVFQPELWNATNALQCFLSPRLSELVQFCRQLEMDAVCELGMNVAKIWEPLVELNQDRFLLQQIPEEFYQIIQHKS